MQYSLGMLKPDCLERGLARQVFKKIVAANLCVIANKMLTLEPRDVEQLYERNLDKEFFTEMSLFLQSGQVHVFLVSGDDAIARLNQLVGSTDPQNAGFRTIRGCFGESIRRNICHSSEDEKSFWTEISIFFSENELNNIGIQRQGGG